MSIAENLSEVQDAIAAACRRANRPDSEVALMAVSKVHPIESILEAHAAGQRLFGENRVQEFAGKSLALGSLFNPGDDAPEVAQFHLIGPLQNNKTGRAAELFHAVDTIDSTKTAHRLSSSAGALGRRIPVLVEVKLSHEETKHGVAPAELPVLLDEISALENVELRGLMTVPPWSLDPEPARPYFRRLRELRDLHASRHPGLDQLSMGMSNDFAVAIEEGSTVVRIGTAIFGKRQYHQ